MPRLSAIASAPAAIILRPSRKMPSASTVAVVVPSPATSLVLLAASLTSCAPRFSNGSSSSMSWATVTPSLVTLGEPQPLSSTALRPRGPSVLRTARANFSTPAANGARASSSNTICFAATRHSSDRQVNGFVSRSFASLRMTSVVRNGARNAPRLNVRDFAAAARNGRRTARFRSITQAACQG